MDNEEIKKVVDNIITGKITANDIFNYQAITSNVTEASEFVMPTKEPNVNREELNHGKN